MGVPQSRFEFVATGDAAVNAQIEQVVNKLVKMKMQARETTESAAEGMEKARMSTHLLNEELGLHIPRAMQKIMATTPGLTKALQMAFSVTAAVGFVEIVGSLIEKMPELTNAMMGFGEEAQKVFNDLKTANAGIQKAIEDNQKQAMADMLLGLSGSALDKGQLEQMIALRDTKIKERVTASRSSMHLAPAERVGAMLIPQHTVVDPDAQKRVQELTAEITRLDGAIASAGKHLTHDLGDEEKKKLEELAAQAQKAKEAFGKFAAGQDASFMTPTEQALKAEQDAYNKDLAVMRDALNRQVITLDEYNARKTQRTIDHFAELNRITREGWQNLISGNGMLQQGSVPDILFAGTDPFAGMRKQFADAQKFLQTGLEEEAAKEKVISDTAKATGEDQYATEQKLMDIRGKSAAQLQAIADKMEEIAHAMGDAGMIADADKFEAKLQDLRVKTASWGAELRKALTQDGENLFVGLTSGAQGWAQAFQNAGQSILAELSKIIYQLYIVKLLQAAIGGISGMFGGGGGSGVSDVGSGLSSITAGIGNIFGGARASGGPVLPGMTYMVGERGPEPLIMGRSGGFILPHSSGASSVGGGGLQVNIHNYGPPMEQQQTSRIDVEGTIVDVVVKNIQNNGAIGQMMRK